METRIINKFGKMAGWNSITVNLLGRDVEGISSLSYSDELEKENVYGAGKYPVGRGEGNYTAEASITLFKEEQVALTSSMPVGGRVQDIAPFDIIVQYDYNGRIVTDIIRNAEFKNSGTEVSSNDKSTGYQYDLIVSHIDYNV